MTDIMQSWKENRFIVAGDVIDDTHLVVLTDIGFWIAHADELKEWCESTPGAVNEGMTVVFDNEHVLTLFVLRWS